MGSTAGVGGRARRTPPALLVACLAAAAVACAPAAGADVVIAAGGETYTGASFFARVDASDPDTVVLVEWDFDGDGRADANGTDAREAGHTYLREGAYTLRVTVTRAGGAGVVEETASAPVLVHNGTPTVAILVPERTVAGVPLVFRALPVDPDASPAGEDFTFEWSVDGAPLAAVGAAAQVLVEEPGTHTVALVVTDEEGVSARSDVRVDFGAPGVFEGRQGVVNLGLLIAAVALGAGLALARLAQRERQVGAVRAQAELASAAGEAAAARRKKPEKVPFQAAAEAPGAGGARVVHGGTPAALARTKECPVCHSAIDADLDPADCPYCRANAEAEALEATLAGPRFADVDLSEVRALLQRARRERHLGRTDEHSALVAQARERADALLDERAAAQVWLEKAREAVERATSKTDAERLDRAHSYLKLAESLSKAHQHGKVQRHAQRCVEILSEGGAGMDAPDRCHACGGAVAAARAAGSQRCPHCDAALQPEPPGEGGRAPGELEAAVRAELHAVRGLLSGGDAGPDEEAWSLLQEAEAFEREAAWPQALELLRTLRERFERERDAAAGPRDPPDVSPPPPPGEP